MSTDNTTPENNIIEGEKIENSEKKSNKARWVYIALILFIAWLMFNDKGRNTANTEEPVSGSSEVEQNIETPVIDNTITNNITSENNSLSGNKEVVISESYQPVADIYTNTKSYNNNTFRVAFKGEFDQVNLSVKAKTENGLDNFVSLNIGTFSGIYQKDGQNVKFTKDQNFEANLNMKMGEDFSKKQQNTVLWNYLDPKPSKSDATLVRFYATTIDQNGKYSNNSQVIEFKINYTCAQSDPACEIAVCGDEFSTGGQCLAEKFGAEAAKNYIESFR